MRKGLAIDLMIKVVVIIFIALILLGFGKIFATWLQKLLGFDITMQTEASAIAIRCAIDSMALGEINDYACIDGLKTQNDIPHKKIYSAEEALDYITDKQTVSQFSQITYRIKKFFMIPTAEARKPVKGYAFAIKAKDAKHRNVVVFCGTKNDVSSLPDDLRKQYFYEFGDEFICKVFNLEMNQRYKLIGYKGPSSPAIPSWGDPDYIIYYERFPDGEEKAWLDVEDSWGTTGIFIAGAVNAIPFAGRILKLAFKESGKVAFKLIKEGALFWKGFVKKDVTTGMEAVVKSFIRDEGVSMTDKEINDVAEKIVKGKYDEAIDKLTAKGVSRESAEDFVHDWSWLKGLSKDEVRAVFRFERQIDDIFLGDNGMYFGLERTKTQEFFRKWKALPVESEEQQIAKMKMFSEYISGKPVVIDGATYSLTPAEVQAVKKFVEEQTDKFVKTYAKYYYYLPPNGKRLYNKEVGKAIETYLKTSRSFRLMMIEGMGEAGLFDKYSAGRVDVDGDGVAEDVTTENMAKCLAVAPGGVMSKGACFFVTWVGFASIWLDARTYYKPVGVNSLAVYYPWIWFSKGKSKEYPLIKEAMPYYIELDRGGENPRFYLASPCYANVIVKKVKGACSIPSCKQFEEMLSVGGGLFGIFGSTSLTEWYSCSDATGNCVLSEEPSKAKSEGICWCISEAQNPCYDVRKCNVWLREYMGCFPLQGTYVPYAVYTFKNKFGVENKFMIGGVDYHKYNNYNNPKPDMPGYKICNPPGWFDKKYTVDKIVVIPVMADLKDEPNYCFWAKGSWGYKLEKLQNDIAFLAIDLLIGESPLVVLSGMAYAYFDEKIDEKYRYPNHPEPYIWLFLPLGIPIPIITS